MKISRRSELALGLLIPLAVLIGLVLVGASGDQAYASIAFMAAVPMFAAMFTGVVLTGIVAVAALLAGMITAVAVSGSTILDALPILIGLIVTAAAAVMASQMKFGAVARRTSEPRSGGSAGNAAAVVEPGIDGLTGLPTRSVALLGVRDLDATVARVVVFMDCDGLAAVNDEYGHPVGDEFLFAVAGRTRYALADDDTVARWNGGELMLVIASEADAVGPTLELVTDKVNRNPIRTGAGLIRATISVGAAPWPAGTDFAVASAQARRALYAAKCMGPGHLVYDGPGVTN